MKAASFLIPRFSWFAALLLIAASAPLPASPPAPEARANGELLAGAWTGSTVPVARFSGIPFARPPVGDLRWRAPRSNPPREGRQDATRFADACMQGSGAIGWYAGVAGAFGHGPEVVSQPKGISEDCLYLNVWTSNLSEAVRLPVMVYVHGGSNKGGWSYEPNYHGHALAARGVVVVTIAYRLGPFGFFSHPALDDGSGEPQANFALLDIQAAFEWVRWNIAAFGGDPDNITAFGESAGAFNLLDLLLADLDRGAADQSLFRRLILQSIGGPPQLRRTLGQEQEIGQLLAVHMGLAADTDARQLRGVPAGNVLAAVAGLPAEHYFSAAVDVVTLPRAPLEIMNRLEAAGVRLIAGSNADEWYMYLDEETSGRDVDQWISDNAPEHREALQGLASDPDPRRALDRLITAREMLCPSRNLARQLNESGGKAWVYSFERQRPGQGGSRLGAYHGAELPYVFNRHDDWLATDHRDRELTEAMMDYWTGFARTGNPNSGGNPEWPAYTGAPPRLLVLGDDVAAAPDRSMALCALLGPDANSGESSP